ncbi:MAG: dTMP kinase [Mycoplasmataceae bacterium]|nr:dTMP kinase [Mycoplasmataceae bacterium]
MSLFITFEGPDGSGKTSILNKVFEQLQLDFPNKKIVLTREPGDIHDKLTVDIRNLLLNKMDYSIDYRAEALLFAADRAQHIAKFVKPNLDAGNIVLCDRFVDSNIVYQGFGRKLGVDNIWKINDFAMNNCLPNATFILMVTPEVGMERINANVNREVNRLDKEKMQMHKQVYDAYKYIIENDKLGRIKEIDASKSFDEVFSDVYSKVKALIK